jgi:hypothetical protein
VADEQTTPPEPDFKKDFKKGFGGVKNQWVRAARMQRQIDDQIDDQIACVCACACVCTRVMVEADRMNACIVAAALYLSHYDASPQEVARIARAIAAEFPPASAGLSEPSDAFRQPDPCSAPDIRNHQNVSPIVPHTPHTPHTPPASDEDGTVGGT